MIKNTINKLFFNKKKKKNQPYYYEKDVSLSSESDLLDDELKSAKKFIQNYRKNFLNLDKPYKEVNENSIMEQEDFNQLNNQSKINQIKKTNDNQISLISLQNNLKEYKMYINEIINKNQLNNQLNNNQKTKSTDKTNQKTKLNQLSKYFNLKINNRKIKQLNENLRSYLNQSNTFYNQQFIKELNDLNSKRKLNERYDQRLNELGQRLDNKFDSRYEYQLNSIKTIEKQFREHNFCNCKRNMNDQSINQSKNKQLLKPLTPFKSKNYSNKKNSFNKLNNRIKEIDLNNNENYQLDYNIDDIYTEFNNQNIDHLNYDQYLKNLKNKKQNLEYISNYDTDFSIQESKNTLICYSDLNNYNEFEDENYDSVADSDDQITEDEYLDTYTIESVNTEDNPISIENFIRLIKKLTYLDVMRSKLLKLCDQKDALDFNIEFSSSKFPTILNLDSGTFGVTFLAIDKNNNLIVLKVIRTIAREIQSRLNQLSYSGVENFDEVYNEVMISKTLSSLHYSDVNRAHCFPKILFTKLVKGPIPDNFYINKLKETKADIGTTIEQFCSMAKEFNNEFKTRSTIMNNRKKFLKQEPFKIFPDAPIEYTVIGMKYVGKPIWRRLLNDQLTSVQLFSIVQQLIFSLACAEQQFNFEHRDLHISNILIKRTKKSEIDFMLNNQIYKLSTNGYRCFIIDMTFSRLTVNNQVFYKDLSQILYKKQDHKKLKMQDLVYQSMRDEIGDNWHKFRPRTNIQWLIYVLKTVKNSELFKNSNDLISQLLIDYYKQANECSDVTELIDYVVERSS